MTWSIVAKDPKSGRLGIAVASRFFAVGTRVPSIKAGAGAIANQAFVNPYWSLRGMALLSSGAAAEDAVRMLVASDEDHQHRQIHLQDREGRCAAFTGKACIDWAGHRIRQGFSVAGNMLAGPDVVEETVRAYEAGADTPFARRLIAAMKAGEAAGGDKRGKQAAALLIHDDEDYALLDIRADDHPDPLAELSRLEEVARDRWLHFRRLMPNRASPYGLTDRTNLEDLIARSKAEGYE